VFGEITGRVKNLTAIRRRGNSKAGKKTVDGGNRRKHFRPESFCSRFSIAARGEIAKKPGWPEKATQTLIASQEVTLAPCIL